MGIPGRDAAIKNKKHLTKSFHQEKERSKSVLGDIQSLFLFHMPEQEAEMTDNFYNHS